MRKLLGYQFLYGLFWLSVFSCLYFVHEGLMNLCEACTVNISLLALAVSTHSNVRIQSEKVKEIVREHLLLLYDAILLTQKHLEADLTQMEDVYTDVTALDAHLALLANQKAEIARLSSRLSFFIDEKRICETTDDVIRQLDELIAEINFYKQHEMPSVLQMVEHLKRKGHSQTDIRSGLKASLSAFDSTLKDIRQKETTLAKNLKDGPVVEKLRTFRALGQIKLTHS